MELKDILKGLRERKQVSMDKMCEELGKYYNMPLAKSTISKWENGKAEPNLSYARVLTKYFGVTLDYLLGLENEKVYNLSKISKKETTLLSNFNKLNETGKDEAIKRVEELTQIDKYTHEEKDHLMPIAAHDKEGKFSKEDMEHDLNLMKDDELWK
ncbi:hypothetical protein C3B72_04865 [Clostridium tetani]|uniref:helix-turn-helix domain-containing protein n=1 Tax=Clostridium tetani TaxID=1513 RepID=UPI000D214F81|nr:helix-turn-helix transcriptional regulator [Clostridium tetani]AVP54491.1 hypothetical protein C3B72_04865 [Clostridium tetani]